MTVLRNLNLLNEKHIPENYLHGSVEQRYELLRGLMDSDGCVDLNGRCEFTQSYKKHNKLLKDISILLDSLGIKHNISYSKKKEFNSWDKFQLPFPFSKVIMDFLEPIKLEKGLDTKQIEKEIEEKMNKRMEENDKEVLY